MVVDKVDVVGGRCGFVMSCLGCRGLLLVKMSVKAQKASTGQLRSSSEELSVLQRRSGKCGMPNAY